MQRTNIRLWWGSVYRLLNKNIKEFNKVKLSTLCIVFLLVIGFISYKINSSYALFSDSITGAKTIEATVDVCKQNKPNTPVLDSAMIPVYYDEASKTWKKADSTNKNNNWYDYCEKKWANSVTVSSTNRSKYQSASIGTEIPMSDILTMEVWIPRYKYEVWNYNSDGTKTSAEQEIKISWESETNKTGEIICEDAMSVTEGKASETCKLKETNETCTDDTCNNITYTHPAFTFGDEEIKGFWVGKFELTGTISDITTKPDSRGLLNQTISNLETNIMKMNASSNNYGLITSTDTHMIKNIEWGAVAYLSHSRYGACTDGVCEYIPPAPLGTVPYTGCKPATSNSGGGGSSSSSTSYYNKASCFEGTTTQNIYGVYGMSGGILEYTMGNMISNDRITMLSGNDSSNNSGYTGKVYDSGNYTSYTGIDYPNNKYYDKYSFSTDFTTRIRSKLGDGIKEVYLGAENGWPNQHSYSKLVFSEFPWFVRGGSSQTADRSVFNSVYWNYDSDMITSRFIITP